MKAAEAMVKYLEQEGITVVFGYPGAAVCPFYDYLSKSSIRHILVRHEQHAGHEANGYAATQINLLYVLQPLVRCDN